MMWNENYDQFHRFFLPYSKQADECILKISINQFSTNVLLLYPRETSESRRISDVFRGYKSGT